MRISKSIAITGALFLASAAAVWADDPGGRAQRNDDRHDEERQILEFRTMIGVPRPYTGSANAIRVVPGCGLPWVVSSAKGELGADGRLEIKV